ncbi:Nitroreductase-like protein, partial [Mycena amicta]
MDSQPNVDMVNRLLKERFAARYYLPAPISLRTIEEIVDAANGVPSGFNIQPWKVYAVSGSSKDSLVAQMLAAHEKGAPSTARFDNDSVDIPEIFAMRRAEFGKLFFQAQGVQREDVEGRRAVDARNYKFFDSPVALIFTLHAELKEAAWLDLGAFMQGITIGARVRGFESIPQLSIPRYDAIIRAHLHIPAEEIVACGMAIGYPDQEQIR